MGIAELSTAVLAGSTSPYATSEEHLWDELERIDRLVRAQTVRWRLTIGSAKPEHLWGMVHVTEAEVEAYLQSSFSPAHHLPAGLEDALTEYWKAAGALAESIRSRVARTPSRITLRLRRLQELFGLSNLERDILLVCLLPELDARYRRLYGYLQDDASRTSPTVELALEILHPVVRDPVAGREVFARTGRLQTNSLLDVGGPGGDALPMRSIHLDDRIGGYLLGSDVPDSRLAGVISQRTEPMEWDGLTAEPERIARLQTLAGWWRHRQDTSAGGAVLLLQGPYGSGRLASARALCTATDTSFIAADVGAALRSGLAWERIVDLTYREARLQGAALCWLGCDVLLDRDQPPHSWDDLLRAAERYSGLTCFIAEKTWEPAGRFHDVPYMRLEFPPPGYELRHRLWETKLPTLERFVDPPPDRSALADALANGFQLTEGQIIDALATARRLAASRDPMRVYFTVDDLYEGCRRQSGQRLVTFARRIEPRTDLTFDDLILPEANVRQLRELRSRIRHRGRVYSALGFERRLTLGRGLIAMFTGSSGTGKTMAAELLAREQRVDLYKVDLSAVVSKYVGETEKNLSRVFAEAEDINAIIFFDEADALFGKRGEVREARDRWANIEINFLLQRIEEYAGVVILASNLRQNIDEAFMRRIHVIVEFPLPDAGARARIWRGVFPPGINRPQDSDIQILADRFRLSGASIRNIVVDAAFRALAEAGHERPAISSRHLVASTAREYQKLGKPITKGEFGEPFYAWVEEDILLSATG